MVDVKASDMKEIVLRYPEFFYQQRKNFLAKKFRIILKNSNKSRHYLKDMFLRHPTIFLKSYSSFLAKERFLLVHMGKNLKSEVAWPMLLKMNLNGHIKPRCQIAYKKDKDFNLMQTLIGTDQEF